jgi:hypothetical protein
MAGMSRQRKMTALALNIYFGFFYFIRDYAQFTANQAVISIRCARSGGFECERRSPFTGAVAARKNEIARERVSAANRRTSVIQFSLFKLIDSGRNSGWWWA